MSKTILFGGSGFFGPIILKKNPEISKINKKFIGQMWYQKKYIN